MKSAIGIGALLMDGLGDTIRVSLTEDPEFELIPCKWVLIHPVSLHTSVRDLATMCFQLHLTGSRTLTYWHANAQSSTLVDNFLCKLHQQSAFPLWFVTLATCEV